MTVEFFCPRWGAEQIPWEPFLKDVKSAGYKGVEWFPNSESIDINEVLILLKKYDLQLCIVMTVVGEYPDFEGYLKLLKIQLSNLSKIGNDEIRPLFITAQVGREYFSFQQIISCIECCNEISATFNIPIYQETHRNKWAFAAHILQPILKHNLSVMITLDVSHWFCVSESYLEDQQDAVALAITRTRHVHARIGHTQSAQVPDPSLPQYQAALNEHLKIWDQWINERKLAGADRCTITTEFGPPPYLTVLNNNVSPQLQQWNHNIWMKNLLHDRYNL